MEITRNTTATAITLPGSWHFVLRLRSQAFQLTITRIKLPDFVLDWR